MVNPEREINTNPENTLLVQADPAELIQNNPAALIVNKESYQRMAAHFSPDQLDPPQVAQVKTYSSDADEIVRRFVVDGLTRTKYAYDHRDTVLPDYPNFRFVPLAVRDVTTSLVRNPLVVMESEKQDAQDSLTMLQYLRAVVPPTIEHAEIAKDRIAGHLINGWKSIVGEELADRFSALAALNLLASRGSLAPSEQMLQQFLSKQETLVADESLEERQRLEGALQDMASIIRQTKLLQRDVVVSAFTLVGIGAPVIGGQREAVNQVQGLLRTAAVEDKLTQVFSNVGDREQARIKLGNLIAANLGKFVESPSRDRIMAMVGQVLRDKYLSYDHITTVFSAEAPIETYQDIRQEINITNIQKEYAELHKKDVLTAHEGTLLSNLGKRMYAYEGEFEKELPVIMRSARRASEALESTNTFTRGVAERRVNLIQMGVHPETIQNALASIQAVAAELLSAETPQVSAIRVRELQGIITNAERQIEREAAVFKAGALVDKIYGEELQVGFGLQVRRGIVQYVLREVGMENEVVIKQRLNQLHSLDSDLQAKIIAGEIRLQAALSMHAKRHSIAPIGDPPLAIVNPDVPAGPSATVRQDIPIEVKHPVPPSDEPLVDTVQAEQRRIEINNAHATQAATIFVSELDSIDLDTHEVSPEAARTLAEAFNRIGRLLYRHPDAARVIREDYPRLIEQQTQSIANKIDQEQEKITKGTRTSR